MPSHPDGSHGSNDKKSSPRTIEAIRNRTPGLGKARKRVGQKALRKATTAPQVGSATFRAVEKRAKLGGRLAKTTAKASVKALGRAASEALLTLGGAIQLGFAQKGVDAMDKLHGTKTPTDPRTITARKRFARVRAERSAERAARKSKPKESTPKAKSAPATEVNRPKE